MTNCPGLIFLFIIFSILLLGSTPKPVTPASPKPAQSTGLVVTTHRLFVIRTVCLQRMKNDFKKIPLTTALVVTHFYFSISVGVPALQLRDPRVAGFIK